MENEGVDKDHNITFISKNKVSVQINQAQDRAKCRVNLKSAINLYVP
jgi:hypothetical protein